MKLMSDNKQEKWEAFAREMFAVIFGVLIAFWVESYSHSLDEDQLRSFYFEELKDNLQKDLDQINLVIQNQEMNTKIMKQIVDNNYLTESQMQSDFAKTISNETFYPTMGAYRSMIAEGSLSLIEDKTITSSIVDLYEFNYERSIYLGSVLDTEVARLMWEIREFYSLSNLKFYDSTATETTHFRSLMEHRFAYIMLYLGHIQKTKEKIEVVLDKLKSV
jgi:hypothetical protein